jgi:hypothetical protein
MRWTFVCDSCYAQTLVPLLVGYKISKEQVGNESKVIAVSQHLGSACLFNPKRVVMILLAACGPTELTSESRKNGLWGGEFTRVVYNSPENQSARDSMSLVQLAARFDIEGDNTRGMLPEFVHKVDINECMNRNKVTVNQRQIPAGVYWSSNIPLDRRQRIVSVEYDELGVNDAVEFRRKHPHKFQAR